MHPDRVQLWSGAAALGSLILPLVDRETWRRPRRHEELTAWGLHITAGERMITLIAALTTYATALDEDLRADELDQLPLKAVLEAASTNQAHELLTGLPAPLPATEDQLVLSAYRLCVHRGDRDLTALSLHRLAAETRRALTTVTNSLHPPSPTCGDLFREAAASGTVGVRYGPS
ncbi:hypothetical protein KUM39_13515 [Streptomyces sp. J2-1]|uniref:hypothetical protein n=1 Tax=Streptomyces corallincola TaxID=2851888 RepID=UPI001C390AAF|nr:hypothetical protein [Streptomyces corallincola]MBV2355377.1 hypothetical protein [Streptomyces corallincola]